ncbi:MAG: hypothetical protein HOP96_03070, partial [Sphingomonas sp.]|nr:hypothetical protein [Sphingomonas sp.]
MAYDRYERERRWRESRPEFSNERDPRAWDRNPEFERNREFGRDRDFGGDRNDRGFFERMGDEFRSWFGDEDDPRREQSRRDWEDDRNARERSRFGDPGRSREWSRGDEEFNRGYGHEQQRRGAFFSSARGSARDDLHYEDWRRRQMDDLDRDYDDYRRERQSRFEDDFGQWRNRRQSKREL